MTTSVALYTRLSRDATGVQTATHRQEQACRSFAAARGWEVVEVFEDVDLSAYRDVLRPSYERLLAAVKAGDVRGVLVWKLDRLARRPVEFERFWAACEEMGTMLASVTEPIDTSTEMGVAMVRILVTFAQMESATRSLRLTAKGREMAEAGRAPSGFRHYGLTQDRSQIVEAEAALIREAARRTLAGESGRTIAMDFNRRGQRSATGKPWKAEPLRFMLRSPTLSGDRSYHGEVVARGCFPAILNPAEGARLRAVLATTLRGSRPNPRHHLLAGFLRCAVCGHRLACGDDRGRRYYRCLGPPNAGCGGVSVVAQGVEEWVTMMTLWRHSARLRLAPPSPPPTDAEVIQLEGDTVAMRQLCTDYYVARTITRQAFDECRQPLTRRIGLGVQHLQSPPEPRTIVDSRGIGVS